jgi:glycosyltransferase involved in cell wall biosynthesis
MQITMRFCLFSAHPFTLTHLTKDVGKIPEVIGRQLGWTVEIVRCAGPPADTLAAGIAQHTPHVRLHTVGGHGDDRIEPAFLRFLWQNARNIDVLMLFHFGRPTAAYGTLYKLLNPKGLLWNKLDLYEEAFERIDLVPRPWRLSRTAWLQSAFLPGVDLISTESVGVYELLLQRYPQLESKLAVVPCGVDAPHMPIPAYDGPRQRLIVHAARLGTEQKATDVLLEAFARSNLWPEWTLVLIGPLEEGFRPWLDAFAARHPEVWRSVHLAGFLDSWQEVVDWYARAAVFCLPSRYESWGLALNEAGYYGCACIATDTYAAVDMLDGGRCGALCAKDNVESLAEQLVRVCRNEALIVEYSRLFQERILEHFTWDRVIEDWQETINGRWGST